VGSKAIGYRVDLAAVCGISRLPQANFTKNFFYLAAGKRLAVCQLHAHGFCACAATAQGVVPTQIAVHALAPIVIPLIIGGGETVAKSGVVNVVFLFHARTSGRIGLAFSVVTDAAVFTFRVSVDIEFIIVISVGLRERIHTVVATDTIVEEHAAVATGT